MSGQGKSSRPILWIVAGPNGSGKSTLYDATNIESFGRSVWIINPDLLTARIREVEGLGLTDANLQAVQRIELWLRASIRAHRTVGVETVLSTPKYRKVVRLAKRYGFEVRLIYVILRSVELNIGRVRLRVAKGGHRVPDAKIRERYSRSLAQLPWFLAEADMALIFDNSGATHKRVALKENGILRVDTDVPPDVASVLKLGVSGRARQKD